MLLRDWLFRASNWYSTYIGILSIPENWHKHPWLNRIFCRLGRHDFMIDRIR